MAEFIVSAFSDEYSQDLVTQCKALNELGINHTEIRFVNGKNVADLTKEEVKNAKTVLDDYGIKVSSIGSPIGKIKIDGDTIGHLEKVKSVCDTALALGAKTARIFSFYLPDGVTRESAKSQIYDELSKIVDVFCAKGLIPCHENEAKIYGESPEKCLELTEYFGGKLMCVFDMGNFVLDGYDPLYAYNILKKHIRYFHIKDALKAGAIVPPGKGEAKIKEILADFKAGMQKDTFITLEPHLQTFDGLNALVGKAFDNPYKYENQRVAFLDAADKLKDLL